MTEKLREQVSALVDEELSDAETGLLLKRLSGDSDLRAAYAQYHTIGALIRGLSTELASTDFPERVRERVAAENVAVVARPARLAVFGRAAGLVAVAASVAVVAVATLRGTGDSAAPQPALASADLTPATATEVVPPYVESQAGAAADVASAQLANKLLSHGAFARTAWNPGIISLRNVGRGVSVVPAETAADAAQNEDGALK